MMRPSNSKRLESDSQEDSNKPTRAPSTKRLDSDSQDDVTKPAKGPSTRSRRALGDITNSFTSNNPSKDGKDAGVNKLVKQSSVSSIAATHIEEVVIEPMETIPVTEDRIYMQREADNIDIRDADNQLLCSEYVGGMYEFFWSVEREFQIDANYMSQQNFINERMRCILVDWLVEVHLKFKMVPETLYLTVNIIDRYLVNHQVRRSKLQLVGVASLLLAAKYEEIYPPELHDLVFITDRAYSVKEILDMETEVCNALQYNLTVPTIHTFLCRYLKAAHADRTMVQMACYLAERSLQEYSMQKFLPSVIAATAIHASRMSLRRHPWSPTLVNYTKYDEPDLKQCSDTMRAFIHNPSTSQTAVSRKYSSPKFGNVARMPVAL